MLQTSKWGCRDSIIAAAYFHAIFYVLSGLYQLNKEYCTALFLSSGASRIVVVFFLTI